jgi:hypothetical protein
MALIQRMEESIPVSQSGRWTGAPRSRNPDRFTAPPPNGLGCWALVEGLFLDFYLDWSAGTVPLKSPGGPMKRGSSREETPFLRMTDIFYVEEPPSC